MEPLHEKRFTLLQRTTAMKREIHRMSLRLEQLKRRQEQIIVEMERAVYKREGIQLKWGRCRVETSSSSVEEGFDVFSHIFVVFS